MKAQTRMEERLELARFVASVSDEDALQQCQFNMPLHSQMVKLPHCSELFRVPGLLRRTRTTDCLPVGHCKSNQ